MMGLDLAFSILLQDLMTKLRFKDDFENLAYGMTWDNLKMIAPGSGLVVDNRGNRCCAEDLQWPIQPSHVVFSPPDHVISFSPQSVDVFDVHTMNWLQTIPLKKVSQRFLLDH